MCNKFSFKDILIRCGKTILFIVLLFAAVGGVSYVLNDRNCEYKYKDFFDEPNNFDVLFFGSSHMEVFVSPLELWNKYGFTSYNFGNPEEGLAVTYWVIKNAININKPKIIVLDTYMFGFNDSYISEEIVHYGLDAFPISKTKIDAINDLTDDFNIKTEMLFKLGNYHYRWKELDKGAFKNTQKYMKGNMSYGYWHTTHVNEFEQYQLTDDVADKKDNLFDIDYLDKIIKLCEKENIELVLVTTPHICSKQQQSINNLIEVIASEHNLPYINMVKMNNIIDARVDLYDEQHVNQSGMQKVTDYIGSYIVANYNPDDHRNDNSYYRWNEAFDDYMMMKYEWIMWQDDLDKVLMMLHDENIVSYAFCKDNLEGTDKAELIRLMENISKKNYTIDLHDEAVADNMVSPIIVDMSGGYLLANNDVQSGKFTGKMAYNKISVFMKDYVDNYNDYDVIVVIKDKKTDEVRVIRGYNFVDDEYKCDNLYHTIRFKYFFQ